MTAPDASIKASGAGGPERILIVGGGGRENSLGWALARCPGVRQLWVTPGNGGTADLSGLRSTRHPGTGPRRLTRRLPGEVH